MSIASRPRTDVTGAASGLGRAFCLELAKRGARIVVGDRDLPGAEQTAEQVRALGAEAVAVSSDVSRLEEVEALAAEAEERFGGVDLVINNAGVAVAGMTGEVPMQDWEWILKINLWGVIYGCHVFAPRFKAQGKGHILNVASAAGLLCAPGMGPYNVTKAGVIALSETLCAELAPAGVGVTVLCPTFFRTGIIDNARKGDQGAEFEKIAHTLSNASKIQAADVARIALKCCDENRLSSVPMADGRWAWRLKRTLPELYYGTLSPRLLQLMGRRSAAR